MKKLNAIENICVKNKQIIELCILNIAILGIIIILYMCSLNKFINVNPLCIMSNKDKILSDSRLFEKQIFLPDKNKFVTIDLLGIHEIIDLLEYELYEDRLDYICCDIIYSNDVTDLVMLKLPMGIRTCQLLLINISDQNDMKYLVLSDCANSYEIKEITDKDEILITAFFRYKTGNNVTSVNENYILNVNNLKGVKYRSIEKNYVK